MACTLLVLTGVVVGLRSLFRPDPEPWLSQARRQLQAADLSAGKTSRHLQTGADLLQRYLEGGGAKRSTARLLLAATHSALERTSPSRDNRRRQHRAGFDVSRLPDAELSSADLRIAASLWAASGRLDRAAELCGVLLQRDENDAETLLLAIRANLGLGREMDAVELCRRWARAKAEDPTPWQIMADVYENHLYHEQLIDVYNRLIELVPEEAACYRAPLIDHLLYTGRIDEARQQFDALRRERPSPLPKSVRLREAQLLHAEGRYEAAMRSLGQILDDHPDDAGALVLKGRIRLGQSQVDDALRILTRAVDSAPTDLEAHYLLGQAYARQGNDEHAERHLRVHRELRQANHRLHELQVRAERSPADVSARLALAEEYKRIGLPQVAADWREAARKAKTAPTGR